MVDYLKSFPQDDQGNPIRPPKDIRQGGGDDGCSLIGIPIVLAISAATAFVVLWGIGLTVFGLYMAAIMPFVEKEASNLAAAAIYGTIATLGVAFLWKPKAESKRIVRIAKKALTIALGAYAIACCISAIYRKCTEKHGYGKCPVHFDANYAEEQKAPHRCASFSMHTAQVAKPQARQDGQLPKATARYKMAARILSQRIALQEKHIATTNTVKRNHPQFARYG
jgi:hypothetical protein